MATRRFGASVGDQLESVTEAAGAAVASKNIELTVDCASTVVTEGATTRKVTREEVLIALELFKEYILRANWPPV